ncbi:MAG: hypothetical protein ACK4UV_12285, partial [Ignavibacterium sp.]
GLVAYGWRLDDRLFGLFTAGAIDSDVVNLCNRNPRKHVGRSVWSVGDSVFGWCCGSGSGGL